MSDPRPVRMVRRAFTVDGSHFLGQLWGTVRPEDRDIRLQGGTLCAFDHPSLFHSRLLLIVAGCQCPCRGAWCAWFQEGQVAVRRVPSTCPSDRIWSSWQFPRLGLVGVGGRLRRGCPTAAFGLRRVGSVASEGTSLSKRPLIGGRGQGAGDIVFQPVSCAP